MAYCANNLNRADSTLSTLDDFERKELTSYKKKTKDTTKINNLSRNMDEFEDYNSSDNDDDHDDDVLSAYICTTPKVIKYKQNYHFSKFTQNFLDQFN